MKIEITQTDIDSGKRDNCIACPVALAINRVLPSATRIAVNDSFVSVMTKTSLRNVYLPSEVVRFIHDFDSGRSVTPFSFELPL